MSSSWRQSFPTCFPTPYKYTPDGGQIILQITANDADNTIEIAVSDTGIGIPAQDLPYVSNVSSVSQTAKQPKVPRRASIW